MIKQQSLTTQSEPSAEKKPMRRACDVPPFELEAERTYLDKLKLQRQKIHNLYKDYDKALNRVSQQEGQLQQHKRIINDIITQNNEFQSQNMLITSIDQLNKDKTRLEEELTKLKERLQSHSKAKIKQTSEIRQFYMDQIQTLELQNELLKQKSTDYQQQLDECHSTIREKDSQLTSLRQIIQALNKQIQTSSAEARQRLLQTQMFLKQKDSDISHYRNQISTLESKVNELNYFMELEKEKHDQINEHYSAKILHLKKQNVEQTKQIQRKAEDTKKYQEENSRLRNKITELEALVDRMNADTNRIKEKMANDTTMHNIQLRELERKYQEKAEWLERKLAICQKNNEYWQKRHEKLKNSRRLKQYKSDDDDIFS